RAWRLAITDGGAHHLATAHTLQAQAFHQTFDRAAGNGDAFSVELLPDLVGTVDLHVGSPHTFDVRSQCTVTLCALTSQGRVALLGGVAPIARRGDLQHLADRLDPVGLSMLIDEALQDFRRRSSSAWAKNALASFRISLALRSSLFSRSSSFRRCRSVVVTPA